MLPVRYEQMTPIERYRTISELNRVAVTQPGINEIFRGMCRALKKVVPYDRVGLSLYAPENGALKMAAINGCSPDSFYNVGLMLDPKKPVMDGCSTTKSPLYGEIWGKSLSLRSNGTT